MGVLKKRDFYAIQRHELRTCSSCCRTGNQPLNRMCIDQYAFAKCRGHSEPTQPSTAPVQTASADRNDPEAIVCKRFESTGSRLKKEKVCLPNKEWTKQAEAAEHYLDGVQRGSSNQPGGESLPEGQ